MRAFAAVILFVFSFSVLPSHADDTNSTLQSFQDVQGHLWKKVTFPDKKGMNDVVLSRTGIFQTRSGREEGLSNSELYAYGYRMQGNDRVSLWQLHDYVRECEASAEAEFSEDTPVITDLDDNGLAEVWLTYYVGCRGDVSPLGMKIIMYEGSKKYALRGETFVHVDGMDMGGKYTVDPAFQSAPEEFLRYAKKLWQRNKRQ